MNRITKLALAIVAVYAALHVTACSSDQIQTANRNFLATLCQNGQTLMVQLPTLLLTPAQITAAQNVACSTAFGTTAAPSAANGMAPVFPGPTPAASPTPASTVAPAK